MSIPPTNKDVKPNWCKGCEHWKSPTGGLHYCTYILDTGHKRPTAGGEGCRMHTKFNKQEKGRKKMSERPRINYDLVAKLYSEGKTDLTIAEACGCSPWSIQMWRKKHGFSPNPREGPEEEGTCMPLHTGVETVNPQSPAGDSSFQKELGDEAPEPPEALAKEEFDALFTEPAAQGVNQCVGSPADEKKPAGMTVGQLVALLLEIAPGDTPVLSGRYWRVVGVRVQTDYGADGEVREAHCWLIEEEEK